MLWADGRWRGKAVCRAMAKKKTSAWRRHQFTTDPHVLLIPKDLVVRRYHLEVGLYDLFTLQRLSILDSRGTPLSDQIVITPLERAVLGWD